MESWECVDIEDLGGLYYTCEYCEKKAIRYVHTMSNEHGETLRVGCVCAGKLEGNYLAAKNREQNFKNRIKAKRRFVSKKWKVSQKGHEYLVINKQFTVGVINHRSHFSGWVDDQFLKQRFPDSEAAKAHIFELLSERE